MASARKTLRTLSLHATADALSKLTSTIWTLETHLKNPDHHGPQPVTTYRPTERAAHLLAESTVIIGFDPKKLR